MSLELILKQLIDRNEHLNQINQTFSPVNWYCRVLLTWSAWRLIINLLEFFLRNSRPSSSSSENDWAVKFKFVVKNCCVLIGPPALSFHFFQFSRFQGSWTFKLFNSLFFTPKFDAARFVYFCRIFWTLNELVLVISFWIYLFFCLLIFLAHY